MVVIAIIALIRGMRILNHRRTAPAARRNHCASCPSARPRSGDWWEFCAPAKEAKALAATLAHDDGR
jgi:hypothetical protein